MLFKLNVEMHRFIVLKIGEKFANIKVKIIMEAIKETAKENSGFVFFKITQIETAINERPTTEKIIYINIH